MTPLGSFLVNKNPKFRKSRNGPVKKVNSHQNTKDQAAMTPVSTWEGYAFQVFQRDRKYDGAMFPLSRGTIKCWTLQTGHRTTKTGEPPPSVENQNCEGASSYHPQRQLLDRRQQPIMLNPQTQPIKILESQPQDIELDN